jgi:hypothetical protein
MSIDVGMTGSFPKARGALRSWKDGKQAQPIALLQRVTASGELERQTLSSLAFSLKTSSDGPATELRETRRGYSRLG